AIVCLLESGKDAFHRAPLHSPENADAVERVPTGLKPRRFCQLPGPFQKETESLALLLGEAFHERRAQATAEALLILGNEKALASSLEHYPQKVQQAVTAPRQRLET